MVLENVGEDQLDRLCEKRRSVTVKETSNVLQKVKRNKATWTGHTLLRNCRLRHGFEGKIEASIEVTGRRGRRLKQLLYDLEEKRGYCKLRERGLNRPLWRTRFGRCYGTLLRLRNE